MEKEITTKVCNTCGKVLPVEKFYRCASRPDGYQTSCKECRKKRDRELRDIKRKDTSIYGTPDSPLAGFKPRELMAELRARGYDGVLTRIKLSEL